MGSLDVTEWLEELRQKQARVKALRDELAQLEAELRDARSLLTSRRESERARPTSRHGFTNGRRARPIQEGSSVWWARQVLQEAGRPMGIDELVAKINTRAGEAIKKSTLVSNLSRYVIHHDTFSRPVRSQYGLLEATSAKEAVELPPTVDKM
jgi:hypothetical protein